MNCPRMNLPCRRPITEPGDCCPSRCPSKVFFVVGAISLSLFNSLSANHTKYHLFCHLKCLQASLTNSVDPDQTAPVGAV